MPDWLPQSPEFWSALLGAIVGASASLIGSFLTMRAERYRISVEKNNRWNQIRDKDLRDFQLAVREAIQSMSRDISHAYQQGIPTLSEQRWRPTESLSAVQAARLQASRIQHEEVEAQWARLDESITRAYQALQAALFLLDPELPKFVESSSPVPNLETSTFVLKKSLEAVTSAQLIEDQFADACKRAFADYRR